MPKRPALVFLALVIVAAAGACIVVRQHEVDTLDPGRRVVVETPVKAHLRDGSVIVFPEGAAVTRDSITGNGEKYDALRRPAGSSRGAALNDVVGAEAYSVGASEGKTLAYSGLALATLPLFKVAFGSCPTVYSDSAGVPVLETESFSYSISPLLAKRDVDRLRAQPDSAGVVRLEVRNEALETHYIDHLELLEVRHRPDETVYPAAYGHPLAFREAMPPVTAHDRGGRNVRGLIGYVDDASFASSEATLRDATDADPVDWIDMTLPPPASDSTALLLRVRSSLLTTLLFYDHMLARPGAHSLDWMATDLSRILTVAGFGRWYAGNLGLRVQVLENGKYRQVARLADFGPIAWRHVGVMIPSPGTDSLRVRLEFTADQWRIDQVNVAAARRVRPRSLPLARVRTGTGDLVEPARDRMASADDGYLTTQPSQRFHAEFDAGHADEPRTFLLAAHGYYVEWVRGEWLSESTGTEAFDPDKVRMGAVLREWRAARDSMERAFFNTRVPVL